jgi:hypothetical protein
MKTEEMARTGSVLLKVLAAAALLAVFSAGVAGCATGSAIATGTPRTPTRTADVKLYLDPPAHYETLGLVEAETIASSIATQATQNILFDGLKRQAATLGANGVIVLGTEEHSVASLVRLENAKSASSLSQEKKTAKGKAIFVIRE